MTKDNEKYQQTRDRDYFSQFFDHLINMLFFYDQRWNKTDHISLSLNNQKSFFNCLFIYFCKRSTGMSAGQSLYRSKRKYH